jgi:tetratricopeptide (TPR) repeat protein
MSSSAKAGKAGKAPKEKKGKKEGKGKKPPSLLSPTGHVLAGIGALWNFDLDAAAEKLGAGKGGKGKLQGGERHPRKTLCLADVEMLVAWVTGSTARRKIQLDFLTETENAATKLLKTASASDDSAVQVAKTFWKWRGGESGSASASASATAAAADGGSDSDVPVEQLRCTTLPADASPAVIAANVRLDLDVILADVWLFRATAQMQQGDRLKAVYNMRKAWKAYERLAKLVDLDGSDGDATVFDEALVNCVRFGVGLFFFIISFVPGQVAKLVELIGFVGDRKRGVAYLRAVSESSTARSPFASLVLLLNYLMIPRAFSDTGEFLAPAGELFEHLDERFPSCPPFNWLRSHYYRKTGDVQAAITTVSQAIASVDTAVGMPANNFKFDLGCCYFMIRDWEKAAEVFELLAGPETEEFDLKGMSNLQLASCYAMMDRDDEAMVCLREMDSRSSGKSRFDKVAQAKAKRCCAHNAVNPFLGFEILYLRRDLAHLRHDDLRALLRDVDELAEQLGIVTDSDELGGGDSSVEEDEGKSDEEEIEDEARDALGVTPKKTAKKDRKKLQSKQKAAWSSNLAALRATYSLIRGAVMMGLGKPAVAAKSYAVVLSLEKAIGDEKYLLPYAMCVDSCPCLCNFSLLTHFVAASFFFFLSGTSLRRFGTRRGTSRSPSRCSPGRKSSMATIGRNRSPTGSGSP